MDNAFGKKLKEIRRSRNMTAEDVSIKMKERGYPIAGKTLAGYENGVRMPNADTFMALMAIYGCSNILQEFSFVKVDYSIPSDEEWELIEKYRKITKYFPSSHEFIFSIMDREASIADSFDEMQRKLDEAKSKPSTVIEFHGEGKRSDRLTPYLRSGASAGSGVYVFPDEVQDYIPIPDTEENRIVDFAVKVVGNSMEPDYSEGDIVLVSQKSTMQYGDVGVFICDGSAFIKEYGRSELVSRNAASGNIAISEFGCVVCLGKVVGKLGQ